MNDSTRRRGRLWSAPILLIVLATTTGWGQSTAPAAHSAPAAHPAVAGSSWGAAPWRATDDVALAARRLDTSDTGHQVRPQPQRGMVAVPKRAAPAPAAAPARVKPVSAKPSFSGRNHVWIPALGISRPVYLFACTRKRAPDNLVYRWGCAGHNNVYLLGHAYGVFKPLHDAYVTHRLHVGMLAIYADGNGRIRTFRVTTWRVVDPSNSNWAVASQPVPSMTLQTCVGPSGSLRLNVRLIAVN